MLSINSQFKLVRLKTKVELRSSNAEQKQVCSWTFSKLPGYFSIRTMTPRWLTSCWLDVYLQVNWAGISPRHQYPCYLTHPLVLQTRKCAQRRQVPGSWSHSYLAGLILEPFFSVKPLFTPPHHVGPAVQRKWQLIITR